jgi:hypothetical protein
MADVLSVIADVLNQDKQQKKEQAKMMREVQKKLKDKGSEEVAEEEGDKEDYMKFFAGKLKKYGVKSPSELDDEKKKKFFNEIEKDWTHDSKEEVEVEEKEEDLGKRVKSRMEAEEDDEEDDEPEKPFDVDSDSEEDEDEAPVGDQDEPETEPEGEPSEEQIDKIADLVIQKLKDKADDEEDEEEAPEPTEAQGGKEEKIDTKPEMESWESSANPHARYKWLEALRQVNEHCGVCDEQGIEEVRDHKGEIPEPIKVVIQSFGKKLSDYAKKSGGMDKDLFLDIAKDAMAGKLPNPKYVWKQDTAARDVVLDSMAKEFGWMYVENKYNVTFRNRRDFVEEVELAISEALDQEKVDGRRKSFKEAIRRLIYMKMKEARRQNVKEWWNVKLKEDWIEDKLIDRLLSKNRAKAAKIFNAMNKRDKMKYLDKVQSITSRNHGYTDDQVVDALDDHGIDISKEARKQWEEVEHIPEVVLDEALKPLDKAVIDAFYYKKEKAGKVVSTDGDSLTKMGIGGQEIAKWNGRKIKITAVSDVKSTESILKYMKKSIPSGLLEEVELDEIAPWKKGKYKVTDGKTGKVLSTFNSGEKAQKYVDKIWDKGDYDSLTVELGEKVVYTRGVELDESQELQAMMALDDAGIEAVIDRKGQIVIDKKDLKKAEKAFKKSFKKGGAPELHTEEVVDEKEGHEAKGDSIEGPAKGLKHKCPTHVKKEEYGYGINLSHTLSENIVDKMNIYWFDTKEISHMMPTSEVQVISEGYHDESNHVAKFKSTKRIAEGYMVMPGIDRDKYTEMRGLEGPFMTRSGKVLYYDAKAGEYYDRDSDIYLSYTEYLSFDKETSAQKAAMKQGPLADPKSKEYKKMEKDKAKAEKAAKKQYSMRSESMGVARARKFYQKVDE